MKTGFTFSFPDSDRSKGISYRATYDKELVVESYLWRRDGSGLSIPTAEHKEGCSDPWGIFYKHATFYDIIGGLALHSARGSRDMSNDTDDEYLQAWGVGSVPAFLKAIADNPDRLLHNIEALHRFVQLLWFAKTGRGPSYLGDSREQIKKMLVENLVPKHKGGRKYIPAGLQETRFLMKALAKHLSERYLNFLAQEELVTTKDDWDHNYKQIIEWENKQRREQAQDYNHEDYSPELLSFMNKKHMNKKQLHDLVYSPADFVDQLLERELSIGLRTINDRSAK